MGEAPALSSHHGFQRFASSFGCYRPRLCRICARRLAAQHPHPDAGAAVATPAGDLIEKSCDPCTTIRSFQLAHVGAGDRRSVEPVSPAHELSCGLLAGSLLRLLVGSPACQHRTKGRAHERGSAGHRLADHRRGDRRPRGHPAGRSVSAHGHRGLPGARVGAIYAFTRPDTPEPQPPINMEPSSTEPPPSITAPPPAGT
jgi:hypothetical protein